ncbi:MAG: ATP-binding protein [Chloroflexi bacterium]|nr:ATP-binding protein [Chloroflexota bacterium]
MERLGDILKRAVPGVQPRGVPATPTGAESREALCPHCGGVGWVTPDVPADHPRFGEAVACVCRRQELEKERRTHLLLYSNLGPLSQHTFEALLPQGRSASPENQERFARALESARAFAAEPRGWLVLTGVSGCGKTHLAAAIANRRLGQGHPAFFASIPDLLDHLRSTFSPSHHEVEYDTLFEQVRTAPLLVLDDLGAQSSTPWAREKLFQIINHRYMAQLPTVITAISLNDVEERWRSRLTDPNILFGRQTWEVGRRELPPVQQFGVDLSMLSSMTFDSFDTQGLHLGGGDSRAKESLRYAFRAAREFAEAPEGWLVLLGGTGCGKTHLAAAIANFCLRRGQSVFFASVPDLLDHFRAAFSPDSRLSYDSLFEEVRRVPLLLLDDFGVHTGTPWAQEKLYQLLNYRHTARLPTVITSPLGEDEMEAPFGSRMVDLRVSTVVHMEAPDFRAGRVGEGPSLSRPRRRYSPRS